MNQHSPLTSTSFADAVLDMVHLPVLLVDAQRQVRWMNEAARSVASWDGGGPEGHFFGRVLGLDRENSDRVLPNDALSSETEWCDVTVPVQLGAARALRVRRKTYRERSGECCALLTVEGAAWWEEPEVDWLTGPRFLMFEADTEGRLVRGAASLGRLLGTAPEDLVGKPIAELLMGDARIRLDESWRRVIEGKHERIAECGLIGADAALHSFSLSLFPIRGIRGGVAGVRIAAVDLETQKDLAYALEAAEERFSVVFRESSDPILILSMRGEILSANTAFEELTGIASEELFRGGKSWTDFVVQEDMNELATLISSMSSGRPQKGCEFRLRLREGEPQWFEQRLSDLHDEKGRPKGFLAVARNIHHRKLVEQALRKEARAMEARHTRAQGLIERLKKFFALTSELPGGLVGFLEGLCEILMDMYEPTLCYIHIHDSDRIVYRCRGGVDLPLEGEKPVGLPTVLSRRTAEAGVPVLTAQVDDDAEARTDPVLAALGIQTFLGSALQDSHGLIRGTISVLDRQSRVVDSLDVELITVAALQVAARLRTEEEEAARQELEAHLR
jgi:PAS domain S-box-containing protein